MNRVSVTKTQNVGNVTHRPKPAASDTGGALTIIRTPQRTNNTNGIRKLIVRNVVIADFVRASPGFEMFQYRLVSR